MAARADILQGTLDLMVLRTLEPWLRNRRAAHSGGAERPVPCGGAWLLRNSGHPS
jgi:hypothetical protein